MKTLKFKRIFALIWLAIILCLIADIYFSFGIFTHYSSNKIGFWITVIRIITTFILLVMSLNLWQIIKAYTDKNNWQPRFYYKLRNLGYLAIVLTLVSPTIQMIIFYPQYASKIEAPESKLNYIFHVCLLAFANSSLMWFLSLSILLFAELLHFANQIKAENESFI